jgi:hypothetical protein
MQLYFEVSLLTTEFSYVLRNSAIPDSLHVSHVLPDHVEVSSDRRRCALS